MTAPARPLLVYDGDCGFCLRWIERWRRHTGERVDYAPYQQVGARFPQVSTEQFQRSVWLFEPDGRTTRAAEAVLRTRALGAGVGAGLASAAGARLALWSYRRVPGVRPAMEAAYAFVAAHRAGALRVEQWLVGRDVVCSRWSVSRSLFRVGLALVCLIAFLSLWSQVDGLAGSGGIAPAASWLEALSQRGYGWIDLPTLAWLDASDAGLQRLCGAGVLLSVLLLLDVAPALCALLIWMLYLSLVQVCNVFLHFQWDSLLVETSLLAALVLPWRLRPAWWLRVGVPPEPPPGALGRALLWWLLFRFMFESGVVKLTQDGNGAWHDLSALSFHYMTQPLPNGLSWWVWSLPRRLHELSALGTFAIEIGVPFLIIAPRRVRHLACALLIALQLLIGLTGNYGFFNLLTIALCLTLLDDQALAALGAWCRRAWRRRGGESTRAAADAPDAHDAAAGPNAPPAGSCSLEAAGSLPPWTPEPREPLVQRAVLALYALVAVAVGLGQVHQAFAPRAQPPVAAVQQLDQLVAPFVSLNSYGLFRTMTLTRPEILVQGSSDGQTWVDYDFRWKPGATDARPRWVGPHMPRLDWQLWFEALRWEGSVNPRRPYEPSGWFASFLVRLLEGEPAVLELLADNPFRDAPPRAVRALLYDFRFADADEHARSGHWWVRERLDPAPVQLSR